MNRNKSLIIMFSLILIVILIASSYLLVVSATPNGKDSIKCVVSVKDPILGVPKINSYECSRSDICSISFSSLSILKQDVSIVLSSSDDSSSKSFSINRFGGDAKKTLSICTSSDNVQINLYTSSGLVDSVSVGGIV